MKSKQLLKVFDFFFFGFFEGLFGLIFCFARSDSPLSSFAQQKNHPQKSLSNKLEKNQNSFLL